MSDAAFSKISEGMREALDVSRELHLQAEEIVIHMPLDGNMRAVLRHLIVQALWKERSKHVRDGALSGD